jgi:hypothetical protein
MSEFQSPVPHNQPRARRDVLIRELEDGIVLIDPKNDEVHTLNLSAAFIWDLCDGTHTVQEIAENIQKMPGAQDQDLLQIVADSIASFSKKGLFEPHPAGE